MTVKEKERKKLLIESLISWGTSYCEEFIGYTDDLEHKSTSELKVILSDAFDEMEPEELEEFFEKFKLQFRKCECCGEDFMRVDLNFTKDCHGVPMRLCCPKCYQKAMEKGYDGVYYEEGQ